MKRSFKAIRQQRHKHLFPVPFGAKSAFKEPTQRIKNTSSTIKSAEVPSFGIYGFWELHMDRNMAVYQHLEMDNFITLIFKMCWTTTNQEVNECGMSDSDEVLPAPIVKGWTAPFSSSPIFCFNSWKLNWNWRSPTETPVSNKKCDIFYVWALPSFVRGTHCWLWMKWHGLVPVLFLSFRGIFHLILVSFI